VIFSPRRNSVFVYVDIGLRVARYEVERDGSVISHDQFKRTTPESARRDSVACDYPDSCAAGSGFGMGVPL
jgi:hypothetical protein